MKRTAVFVLVGLLLLSLSGCDKIQMFPFFRDDAGRIPDAQETMSEAPKDSQPGNSEPGDDEPGKDGTQIDYSGLVTDAYTGQIAGENGVSDFSIPRVNLAGESVEALNQEIWDELYVGVVGFVEENHPYNGGEYIKYSWAVNGDILSLWVESHPVDWAWWDYYVYNVSISRQAVLSKEDFLNAIGMGISEYNELARKALYSSAYNSLSSMMQWADPDMVSMANDILLNTIADANVAGTTPFLDENGSLNTVGLVYSAAGADAYFYILSLEDFELPAAYPDLFAWLDN